jgi:hypothetical protein
VPSSRPLRTDCTRPRLLIAAFASFVWLGCGVQGEGESCQLDSDCDEGLRCARDVAARGICFEENDAIAVGDASAGRVEDPIGDAHASASVPIAPDLTRATLEIETGVLTATISFAPGTFSRTNTAVALVLDTDEDPSTGFTIEGTDTLLGWDYVVGGPRGEAPELFAVVERPGQPGHSIFVGAATVAFPSEDELQFSVSLALLGDDDGRLKFRLAASQKQPSPPWVHSDYMPDLEEAPGVVRP